MSGKLEGKLNWCLSRNPQLTTVSRSTVADAEDNLCKVGHKVRQHTHTHGHQLVVRETRRVCVCVCARSLKSIFEFFYE